MKIQLIDFGGRSPERAHANDAGADVFSPKDEVIRPGDICKLPLGFGLKIPDMTLFLMMWMHTEAHTCFLE